MIHQLRVYGIFDHNRAEFLARFRDHAARIMRRYGFEILHMWESRDEEGPTFVYLLSWPDEASMTQAWEAFMADEEWKEIKRRTAAEQGDLVRSIADRLLYPLAPS